MEPVIRVEDLRFRYDDGTLALDGIDFELYENESVVLFGPNGSGKTTFALHLNGLLTGEGRIWVDGLRVQQDNLQEIRRRIGFLFQNPDEQLFMPTVVEDVAFGLINLGYDPQQAESTALAALEDVGLRSAAERAPYHLSAGEKRRVALAGVMVMKPRILILDEPTSYLDPPSQRELVELLRGLPQAKLMITHDTWIAQSIATRAVFFKSGKIAGAGTVDQIVRSFDWDLPGVVRLDSSH